MSDAVSRFFAGVLVVGGLFGIGIMFTLGASLLEQGWLNVLLLCLFVLLFGWAVWVGIALWQGSVYGRKWSCVVYALQIPMITLPGLVLQWYTGAYLGPVWRFATETTFIFSMEVGATAQFFIGSRVSEPELGINLFAVAALIMLMPKAAAVERSQRMTDSARNH